MGTRILELWFEGQDQSIRKFAFSEGSSRPGLMSGQIDASFYGNAAENQSTYIIYKSPYQLVSNPT